ncbi:cytochrome bd ubiquinol oxidase subunit I [Candidatus Xenohaliotis californiensis]|uniref:Cytochrome bd ubiquinol oxidase subunit I n=1 Tax=Candidatus Xenohaliotis californiensis TaxID=84677 RepID=A0ABP0EWK4_9RICK|nr:cytochrome bd ubiquinol oxidase subunit I [Candidatus Xenohaliotis californiensis]
MFDYTMLSRIQFTANITFHILFPTISIALSWFLFFFKVMYNKTKNKKWIEAYKLWVKIFALTFALGIVTGVTMSFQFGSNWPGFMETVGNIAGPLLAYEVLTSFFLEATFLGIMLFGMHKVSNALHTLATFLVAFGTTFSAFWIMSLNSWMQTPLGFEMRDGVAYPTNWIEIIFNPSMLDRLAHMLIASGLTTSFIIAGVASYQWLNNKKTPSVIVSIKVAVYAASTMSLMQLFSGDHLGLNTQKHQPAKLAAMEAMWETDTGMPLRLFAIPSTKERRNIFEIGIPKLGSLILTHKLNGEIKGLNDFKEHPPIIPLFFSFRAMFGIGILMLITSWIASIKIFRHGDINKFIAIMLFLMTFAGWLATILGWYIAEIGRQPYLVQGVLKTKDAAAIMPKQHIVASLTAYIITYIILLFAYIKTVFYIAKQSVINWYKITMSEA